MQIAVPSTFGIDERDDRLRAYKFGMLARAAAITGVEHIIIYKDTDPKADEERNAELMEKYLSYAECPPYLRKALFPKDPDLQYANILPALQILSHGYSDEFREAVVVEEENEKTVLDAGLDDNIVLNADLSEGERVTLRMEDDTATIIDSDDIAGFWRFTVENTRDTLGTVLDRTPLPAVGTSRHGDPLPAFSDSRFVSEDVVLVFGSAWRGIPELVERGDCTEDQFAGTYNFVPGQHTKTVRTEEAVPMVLGIINGLRSL